MPAGISGVGSTWSSNKKHIAFLKLDKTNNDVIGLFVVDQDGNNEILLMKGLVLNPDWSPDSTKIAFTVYLGPDILNPRIYVINADGSNQRQLTSIY